MENEIDYLIENLWTIYNKIQYGSKYVRDLFPIFKENNFKTKKDLKEYIVKNQQSLTVIGGTSLDLIAISYKNFITDANNYNNYIKKIKNIQLKTQNKQEKYSIKTNEVLINNTIEKEADIIQNKKIQNSDEINIVDTLKNVQNLYEINYKNNNLPIDSLKNIFKIIKSFYNRQDEMCKDGLNCCYIEKQDDLEFPKIDIKDNIYFSTDHHGDLAAFIFSLLESGVAKFKQNSCPVIYFSMKDKKTIDNVEEYIKLNGIKYLIPIPNLEINLNFDGKFICGGDLIDRGHETDSCLCLMYYLLEQNGAKNKIEYIVGNHEYMVIQDSCYYYNQVSNNADLAKNMLIELATDGKMKFASCSNTTMFSHTVLEKDCVISALEFILDNTDEQQKYNNIFGEELNIQQIIDLKDSINDNINELSKEDIELLTKLLNVLFIEKVILIENGIDLEKQDKFFAENTGLDIDEHKGLLWTRIMDDSEHIKGLHQVVGHTPQDKLKPTLENGIIRADTCQSNGYNVKFSNATLLNFRYGQCKVEIKEINENLINEKSIQEYQKPNDTLNIDKVSSIGQSLIYLFDNDLINDTDVAEFYENIVIKNGKVLGDNEDIYDVLIDYSINLLTRQTKNNVNIKELFDNLAVIYPIDEKNKEKYFETFNTIIEYHKIQLANEEYFERDINKFQINKSL